MSTKYDSVLQVLPLSIIGGKISSKINSRTSSELDGFIYTRFLEYNINPLDIIETGARKSRFGDGNRTVVIGASSFRNDPKNKNNFVFRFMADLYFESVEDM